MFFVGAGEKLKDTGRVVQKHATLCTMQQDGFFDKISQFLIPFFTLGGALLISLKYPGYGLIFNLLAQPFWLHSTYKAWKTLDQWGMFLNTVVFTFITLYGVVNYFFW